MFIITNAMVTIARDRQCAGNCWRLILIYILTDVASSFKASSSKGEVNTCEVMASHLHECPAQSDVSSSSCFDRKANALKHNYHRHDFIALMSELLCVWGMDWKINKCESLKSYLRRFVRKYIFRQVSSGQKDGGLSAADRKSVV